MRSWEWQKAFGTMQKPESIHEACDQMKKQFLLNLFDVIDEDGSGVVVMLLVLLL